MPISAIDGCDERHWVDVKDIIFKAAHDAETTPQLVSDDIEVGIIQKRIVQNLYDNPIVICDISGRNPNVMLELGMRLAFDKPVIVVKDDKTSYSFDSSPIEHVTYPRDLRYQSVLAFQVILKEKISAMLKGKNENSFLKSFGDFKVSKLEHVEGTPFDLLLEELRIIRSALRRDEGKWYPFSVDLQGLSVRFIPGQSGDYDLSMAVEGSESDRARLSGALKAMRGVTGLQRLPHAENEEVFHLRVAPSSRSTIRNIVTEMIMSGGGRVFF